MGYLRIKKSDLSKDIFTIFNRGNKTILRVGKSKPLAIEFPLVLDEDLSKIPAMLLDGFLDKNLRYFMFFQKKDVKKINEFSDIIKNTFGIRPHQYKEFEIIVRSKTLCYFLYYCLDINKCDEHTKIPWWIKHSNNSIKKTYLMYSFDMEGSIKDPDKGYKEIRFHSCDNLFIKDLKNFIKKEFKIRFNLYKYYIKNYGLKYYLAITKFSEIKKFSEIGFSLNSHKKRLDKLLDKYKPKTIEGALASIIRIKKHNFSFKDICNAFPYITNKNLIKYRVFLLIKKGYILQNNNKYRITPEGKKEKSSLLDMPEVKLRTNPEENEKAILEFIKLNGKCWRNQIAKSLKIHMVTVKNVLERLQKQGKIKCIGYDKFQKSFFEIK